MATGKNRSVPVSSLVFDSENPRHDPIDNEPAIIGRLYSKEKVLRLAEHIAQHGVSPLDRLAVVPHPKVVGKFVVVEGNRRLCSLKLLRDPAKAPNSSSKKAFEQLKASSTAIPSKIDVVEFSDREQARLWMSVRHEGEQGGVGTVKWDSDQKARFNKQGPTSVNPNAQALELLDYARNVGLLNDEERVAIAFTTITRYLSNPVVRDTLGLVNHKDLTINVPLQEFDRVVRQFLTDAIDGHVNSRSNSKDRVDYAHSLTANGIAPSSRVDVPFTATTKKKDIAEPKKFDTRNSPNPDKRSRIVDPQFKIKISDKVLKRIFDELRSIDPENFAFAGAYLLRAFVEQTAHLYAKKHGLGIAGDLHNVIGRCADKLESDGLEKRPLKVMREMSSDKHSRLAPDTLGAWVHGSTIPTGIELKRRWDTIEPAFKAMLESLV